VSDLKLPSRADDFSEWYNQLVLRAELADYAPVRGCMIVRPYGWTLWENIQQALDARFKATGHLNCGFPMLIPQSFITKEAAHVEGFAPELAVVTHGGGKELEEPLVVRPTSETIIGHSFSKWVQSHRDLPILINQWCSVLRWEMRTKLFLRTAEFYWQEGHTAHATAEEAEFETRQMLDVYTDFAVNEAALPVIPGRKSESERFAGANDTYTIEAMMGDGKALQSATSHNLGQNFARAFDIKYQDAAGELTYCWTTSWGLSTRFIGAIIMAHGDEFGLVLPPRLAPFQAVIVPIYKTDEERATVLEAATRIRAELVAANVRVKLDDRTALTPGFKFNDWELKGVPVRVEVGPKDVANNTVALARRDRPGREGKSFVAQENLGATVAALLTEIQQSLHDKALAFRESKTRDVTNFDAFKEAVEDGFARVWWAGSADDEARIKEETKATLRCIPLAQPGGAGTCFYTGKPATEQAIFAKSY
jgi:prolyl-tRNA synthetase